MQTHLIASIWLLVGNIAFKKTCFLIAEERKQGLVGHKEQTTSHPLGQDTGILVELGGEQQAVIACSVPK